MAVKLLVLDLDGTTLTDTKGISVENANAIRKASESGVKVVIATGRALTSIPEYILDLPISYILPSNGSKIIDIKNEKILLENVVPSSVIRDVIHFFDDEEIMMEIFIDDKAYVSSADYNALLNSHEKFSYRDREYVLRTRIPVDDLKEFTLENIDVIENINFNFGCQDKKEDTREYLSDVKDASLTSSFPHNLEMGNENTSKGKSVKFLCDHLLISLEDVMSMGDGLNDTEMLEITGISVAPSNASDLVKKSAKYVTKSNNEHGVSVAIKEFILKD